MSANQEISSANPFDLAVKCNVKDLCRLCLNTTSSKIEIFGPVGQQINISGMLLVLFNSHVAQNDSWPQNICMACCKKLTEFHGFHTVVKSTEATLVGLCGVRQHAPVAPSVAVGKKLAPEEENVEYLEGEEVENQEDLLDFSLHVKQEMEVEESVEVPEEVVEQEEEEEEDGDNEDASLLTIRRQVLERKKRGEKYSLENPNNITRREISNALIRKFVNLTCELCGEKFSVFEDVKAHYSDVHGQVGYVRCCNTRYEKRQRLIAHIRYHEDPKSFECDVCGKTFKCRNHVQEHLNTHIPPEEREFKCDQCPKSYTKLCRLTAHQKVHVPHEQRQNICPQCNKAFASVYVMRSHIKIVHERSQKRVCEFCARVFNTKEAFVAHQVNHMEQKPPKVSCEYCGKKFKQRQGLLRHMLMHKNPNQVFSCEICGRTAATKRALHMHKKYVHISTPLKCNLCDKEFKRPITLKEHMASHTGQQQLYNCNFCDKMFNSNANRYTHQKRKHPEEWEEERRRRIDAP